MKNYLEHRVNAIDDLSAEEMNEWLNKMVDYLGGDIWLSKACNIRHPIVKLWKRKDFMATNELINFAQAVNTLEGIDKRWLKQMMKTVAGKDVNNVKGAIFEILALSAFANDRCKVVPAAAGNPGIDGTVIFSDDIKLNLSLKYYGISTFEKDFLKYMDEVYEYFLKTAQKQKLLAVELVLQMKKYSNQAKEQEAVKRLIQTALDRFRTAFFADMQNDIARVRVNRMVNYRFSAEGCSHIFLAESPLHKNEYKNLRDKLDDACWNLIRQKPVESDTDYNGIIIHLHENADIDSYQKEMQDYLNENADRPISFIVLYQPAIVFDGHIQGGCQIYHTIKPAVSVERMTVKPRILPELNLFLGSVGLETPKRTLFANNSSVAAVRDMYLYQKGEIYEQPEKMADGAMKGQIRMIAPGIRLSTAFPVQENNGTAIIRANILNTDHLEIT